jgi:hypothetical protein
MASPIAETWVYATMLIENEWGGSGTGFLVMRETVPGKGRVFLATNKHVLHSDPQERQKATRIRVHVNKRKLDGTIEGDVIDIPLGTGAGQIWKEHPDRDVDVLAFDITQLMNGRPDLEKKLVGYDLFLNNQKIRELEITMGEEVVIVGYPLGLKHRTSNLPLIRSGLIATRIGESLEDEVKDVGGKIRKRIIRGFLIDGAAIPGSSGSPVVLKPVIGRVVGENIQIGTPPPVLLGIIAETRYYPIRTPAGEIPSFAGLGLAFDAETVRETIELFFPPAPAAATGGAGTATGP